MVRHPAARSLLCTSRIMAGRAAASRNPWTLSAKGGAGDDTSVHWTRERVDDDSEGGPRCATCDGELDSSMAKPCIICSELHCNACKMRCAVCGYEMCRSCIDAHLYSDSEWIVEVVRRKDGRRVQICTGVSGCLQKAVHKDARTRMSSPMRRAAAPLLRAPTLTRAALTPKRSARKHCANSPTLRDETTDGNPCSRCPRVELYDAAKAREIAVACVGYSRRVAAREHRHRAEVAARHGDRRRHQQHAKHGARRRGQRTLAHA